MRRVNICQLSTVTPSAWIAVRSNQVALAVFSVHRDCALTGRCRWGLHHLVTFLFADDSNLLKSISCSSDCLLLQKGIDSIVTWSKEWKIHQNASKCCAARFSFSSKDCPVAYNILDFPIECSNSYKDLGIMVSSDLSWSSHIIYICSKAYRALHLVRCCASSSTSITLRRRLYLALVGSHLYSSLFAIVETAPVETYKSHWNNSVLCY